MDDGSSSGKPKKRYRVDTRVGHFRWRCVCGDEVCKELTSTLNEEGNIRGGSLTIPTKNADILVPLWERHLKLYLSPKFQVYIESTFQSRQLLRHQKRLGKIQNLLSRRIHR